MNRLRVLVKWTLFALVLGYVCHHAYRLWIQSDVRHRPLSVAGAGWLAAAGAVYAVSWLPSVWFWRELMRAVGGRVSFADAARAYYCGHLGKYIPGKAMVLVIRAAMVKDRGCPPLRAAITASYETLTMMGTGMALGAAIAPLLFRDWMAAHLPLTGLSPLAQSAWALAAVTLLIALSLPFLSKLLTWIAAKATPAASVADKHVEISTGSPAETAQPLMISPRLIAAGCAAFAVSWGVQGLCLGLVFRAVDATTFDLSAWPLWTGAMALSTSLGFAVLFAPGGLGVREGILLAILNSQPGTAGQTAVAVTLLSRVVSFLTEVVISAVLFVTVRETRETSASEAKMENRE